MWIHYRQHRMASRYIICATVFLILLLLTSVTVLACNMSVFRYALERWAADPYQVVIYYDGSLNSEEQDALDHLEYVSIGGDSLANIEVQAVDITTAEQRPFNVKQTTLTLPWMLIYYPVKSEIEVEVWAGPLTQVNVEHLLDSPARSLLAKRILQGEAAVWLLLESGDHLQDERAARLLSTQLNKLSHDLTLSGTGYDANGNPYINLKFSMIQVSRDDPAEEIFINMLLGTESDLDTYNAPLAFPVFGRGRVLYALVGAGINDKMIEEACRSIIGWCSCQIKALNQGTDLLISADWSKLTGGTWIQAEKLPPLAGLSDFIQDQDKDETSLTLSRQFSTDTVIHKTITNYRMSQTIKEIDLSDTVTIDKKLSNTLICNIIFVIGLELLVVIVVSSLLLKRKGERE